MTSLLEVIKRR